MERPASNWGLRSHLRWGRKPTEGVSSSAFCHRQSSLCALRYRMDCMDWSLKEAGLAEQHERQHNAAHQGVNRSTRIPAAVPEAESRATAAAGLRWASPSSGRREAPERAPRVRSATRRVLAQFFAGAAGPARSNSQTPPPPRCRGRGPAAPGPAVL